jgi:hypothetical protein
MVIPCFYAGVYPYFFVHVPLITMAGGTRKIFQPVLNDLSSFHHLWLVTLDTRHILVGSFKGKPRRAVVKATGLPGFKGVATGTVCYPFLFKLPVMYIVMTCHTIRL